VTEEITFWLAAAGLLATCLASIGARSLAEFSPHELKEISRRRKSSERLGQILRDHDQAGLAAETLQVVATALCVASGVFWLWVRSQAAGPPDWAEFALSLAGMALLLLAVEIWIPYAVVGLWGDAFLYHTWPLWRAIAVAVYPLVLGARFIDALFHRLAGRPQEPFDEESFEEDIRTMVNEGHREGLLEEEAREMIEGIIALGEADVAEIMTPRTDMVSIARSLSWQEMLDVAVQSGHTRIPVYDKNRDDIVGVLHVKDLLPELTRGAATPEKSWTALLREPHFVPETKPIDALLQEFQRTRHHLAVVLDEYGGVAGLVTIEDVLEEIVGEIVDEYDKELVEGVRELGEGVFESLGRVHVDEINERLGVELPDEEDFDTIAGLVFHELGHVPRVGEEVCLGDVKITVLEATRRRIERLRIEVRDRTRSESA
jgi:CBS domain containing-hemolysin-like protein